MIALGFDRTLFELLVSECFIVPCPFPTQEIAVNQTFLRITEQPVGLNDELAPILVGLTVAIRSELLAWTEDPSAHADTHFFWLHNDDIRSALTMKLGMSEASRYHSHLPTGRATRIHRQHCELLAATVPTTNIA